MSIELQPLGVKCNLKCTYCYQNPIRDAGNEDPHGGDYDLNAMKRAIEAEGVGQSDGRGGKTGFAVFGGEPLMMPIADLEDLFRYAREKGVPVGIQTNATLITDEHLRMFRDYRVGVGVSMDGPDELNDARWTGNVASTRELTRRSQAALETMLTTGVSVSLIVTLTRVNASPDRLTRLIEWVEKLVAQGLRWLNLHTLEVDHELVRETQALTHDELVAALQAFAPLEARGVQVAPLDAFRRLLTGQDDEKVNCIWHACDPYTTSAVRGVDGRGNRGNCGRTNKDGVTWQKAGVAGHERQLALYLTPQEHGGCAGCRFFFACKGECPGTAERGDWRNRTEHCPTLMAMFETAEARLRASGQEPISLSFRRPLVEARMLEAWAAGRSMTVAQALRVPASRCDVPHGDAPHGDAPHGDHNDQAVATVEHGDHTDASLLRRAA